MRRINKNSVVVNIEFKCGHYRTRREIRNPGNDIQHKLRWFREHVICSDCMYLFGHETSKLGERCEVNVATDITDAEIQHVKTVLSGYKFQKTVEQEFQRRGLENLTAKEKTVYDSCHAEVDRLDTAIRLIQDEEIRKLIELRYVKGLPHKVVVLNFSMMDPVTVCRKLNKGIKFIAHFLKYVVGD